MADSTSLPKEAFEIMFSAAIALTVFLKAAAETKFTIDDDMHRKLICHADDIRCLAAKLSGRECKRDEQFTGNPDS